MSPSHPFRTGTGIDAWLCFDYYLSLSEANEGKRKIMERSMMSTTRPRRRAGPSAVRLRTVPPLDPPFDDEVVPASWAVNADRAWPDDQLVLDLTLTPGGRSNIPPPGRHTERAAASPVEARNDATPEARRAGRRFLDTCLEIINGYRPANQLRPLIAPGNAATIIEHLAAAVEHTRSGPRRSGPVDPVRIRLLRVCEPRPGVVEAAAALGATGRTRAMAFRLERRHGTWVGTAVQVW